MSRTKIAFLVAVAALAFSCRVASAESPIAGSTRLIVGVGGFLGVRRHVVAVPVALLEISEDKIALPGATRDAIKALPAFE